MERSLFVRAVAASLLAPPLGVRAQAQAGPMRRVAVMAQGRMPAPIFQQTLAELGFVEGRNLVIDLRAAGGDFSRFPALLQELIALKPDVIVVETTPGALAAKAATSTIPIVILNVSDPVGSGLAASVTRPGGNITGMGDQGFELTSKSVELMRELLPKATRLGVLMSENPVHPLQLRVIEDAARVFGFTVVPVRTRSIDDLENGFARLVAQKPDAAMILGGGFDGTAELRKRVAELAAKARLPAMYFARTSVIAGGLISYSDSLQAKWKTTAHNVEKILKGAKAADMPIQKPTTFELLVNLKAAQELGITVPQSLLIRADEVIR